MMKLAQMQHVNNWGEQFSVDAPSIALGRPELGIVDEDGDHVVVYLDEPTAKWLVNVCWVLHGPKWMGVEQ